MSPISKIKLIHHQFFDGNTLYQKNQNNLFNMLKESKCDIQK